MCVLFSLEIVLVVRFWSYLRIDNTSAIKLHTESSKLDLIFAQLRNSHGNARLSNDIECSRGKYDHCENCVNCVWFPN